MKSLSDVSLIIVTLNEEESIGYVLEELKDYGLKEIIIVDGNSKDKTTEIAKNFDVTVLNQKSKGYGGAVKEGFNYAKGEYITFMDGDGSYNPISIIEMRELINNYDGVFCSRYKNKTKSIDDTFVRAMGNKFFTYVVVTIFKLNISDSLFFYPMIKKDHYKKLELTYDDFTMCVELPIRYHQAGFNYYDLLSPERERFAGKSKVNALKDGFKMLLGIIKIWIIKPSK